MANTDPKRVVTGEVRMSYVHILKPRAGQNPGDAERYSVTVLIPKSDTATLERINASIEAAAQDGIANKWRGARPPQLKTPLHDGDGLKQNGEHFGAECKGHWVLTASCSADRPPEVVDANRNPIINQSEVYSGIYGRVSIRFFPYENSGNRGIGAGLGNVQKLRDGEVLGGFTSAEDDFGSPVITSQPYMAPPINTPQAPWQSNVTPVNPPQVQINPITGLPL